MAENEEDYGIFDASVEGGHDFKKKDFSKFDPARTWECLPVIRLQEDPALYWVEIRPYVVDGKYYVEFDLDGQYFEHYGRLRFNPQQLADVADFIKAVVDWLNSRPWFRPKQ